MDFRLLAQLADGVGIFIGVFEQPCRVDFRDAAIATGGRLFSDILNYVSSESGARK